MSEQFGYRYTGHRLQAGRDAAFRVLPVACRPKRTRPSGSCLSPVACGLWPLSGFTLLELILVLALIGTVVAMVAPSLRIFCRARETADAAARVLSLTQYARSQAVAEGRPFRLCVDDQASTCWLSAQRAGAFVELECEMGRRFSFPAGSSVRLLDGAGEQSQLGYVQFGPDGRTDEATFEITGRQGEVVRVACLSATEQFRVNAE